MADGREPVALALILCDAIYIDPATGKRSLLGLFTVVISRDMPAVSPLIAVYACLTECHGKVPFTFQVIDVNEERPPVFEAHSEVEVGDPIGVAEVNLIIGNLVFPEPGEYRFRLLSNGHPLIERRLLVVHQPRPRDQEHSDES